MTLSQSQFDAIAEFVNSHRLCAGLYSRNEKCSIAAINLALTGELTDAIPDCMSEVIGHWIIVVQDAMPDDIRNSREWKMLLPWAAGTGREHEPERLNMLLDWMWNTVLPVTLKSDDSNAPHMHQLLQLRSIALHSTKFLPPSPLRGVICAVEELLLDFKKYAFKGFEYRYMPGNIVDIAVAVTRCFSFSHIPVQLVWQRFDPVGILRKLIDVSAHPDYSGTLQPQTEAEAELVGV